MASRASRENTQLVWTRNRGRNGWDCPSDVPPEMSIDSLNIDLVQNALGRRRQGSALQPVTGVTDAPAVLARFSLGPTDTAVELHYTTRAAGIVRVSGPEPVATALTLIDLMVDPHLASWAQLNGKLFWAYHSGRNRLHVYDPRTGNTVRRAGLAVTYGALLLADTATAGTYPAILRYYRVRDVRIDNGVTLLGEAGSAWPFTPSGTHDGVSISQFPGPPVESETHWRVEVSLDDAVWYVLSDPIPRATTNYIDTTPTTAYATKPAAPLAGEYSPFPSVKYLCADQDRLLGFGVWEPHTDATGSVPPRQGRVYFTPVLDSTDTDDDERIDYGPEHPGYIDVGRDKGYEDRALNGPLDGQFFAFQSRGVHMLVPTGDVATPFRRITLSPSIGAVSHASTFLGEDEAGRPCLYFLDPMRGPYRYGSRGLEWCGYDVQDVWATVNHAASVVAHGYYDSTLRAAVWSLATGTADAPTVALVFFVREGQATEVEGVRYGFVRWQGTPWIGATSSLSYPRTLNSAAAGTTIARLETGYLATATGLIKINMPGLVDDAGAAFVAQVESAEFAPSRLFEKSPGVAYVQASAHADPIVTITHTLAGEFARVTHRVLFTLTPVLAETRVLRKLPTLPLGNVASVRVVLGDPPAGGAAAWTIDDWFLTYEIGGDV